MFEQGSSLPLAVRSHDTQDFAGPHADTDAVQRGDAAEPAGDAPCFEDHGASGRGVRRNPRRSVSDIPRRKGGAARRPPRIPCGRQIMKPTSSAPKMPGR